MRYILLFLLLSSHVLFGQTQTMNVSNVLDSLVNGSRHCFVINGDSIFQAGMNQPGKTLFNKKTGKGLMFIDLKFIASVCYELNLPIEERRKVAEAIILQEIWHMGNFHFRAEKIGPVLSEECEEYFSERLSTEYGGIPYVKFNMKWFEVQEREIILQTKYSMFYLKLEQARKLAEGELGEKFYEAIQNEFLK